MRIQIALDGEVEFGEVLAIFVRKDQDARQEAATLVMSRGAALGFGRACGTWRRWRPRRGFCAGNSSVLILRQRLGARGDVWPEVTVSKAKKYGGKGATANFSTDGSGFWD